MKLPLKIDSYYSTSLTKEQVIENINNLETKKQFKGLRTDEFVAQISESGFVVGRNTYGLDGFTLEEYPVIEGFFTSEKPLIINIIIKPSYFTIIFFSIFVFTFIPVGLLADKMTINDVLRSPTIFERLLFVGLGGIIPGIWCYFGYIRPVKKAERWIIKKLQLNLIDNNCS